MKTVRYGDHPDQHVEVWDPAGPPKGSAVLIHGGYWRDRYALDLMHPMARHLVDRGWRVFNIEYRRVGRHAGVWPEMAADVTAAVTSAQPQPVVVIGHSAGGHLALWTAATAGAVDAAVALAPVADLFEADRRDLSDGAVRDLLGGDSVMLPDLYRSASPAALVPLGVPQLIVHGDADDAVPLQMAVDYAAKAIEAADDVELVTPTGVDHFHIIDPGHEIWRTIDAKLDHWAQTLGHT